MTDFNASFNSDKSFYASFGKSGGGSGTRDYEKLINQPFFNGEKIIGSKTSADYHVQDRMDEITEAQIDELFMKWIRP